MPASGVRRSWETQATSSRRDRSTRTLSGAGLGEAGRAPGELVVKSHEVLRQRGGRAEIRCTLPDPACGLDQPVACFSHATSDEHRSHRGNRGGRDEDDGEGPEIVLGEEHRLRRAEHADHHGDDRDDDRDRALCRDRARAAPNRSARTPPKAPTAAAPAASAAMPTASDADIVVAAATTTVRTAPAAKITASVITAARRRRALMPARSWIEPVADAPDRDQVTRPGRDRARSSRGDGARAR